MASAEKGHVKASGERHGDIEAQIHTKAEGALAPEYKIPPSTKYLYLALYFTLNLVLTLYNKAVLGKVRLSSFFYLMVGQSRCGC